MTDYWEKVYERRKKEEEEKKKKEEEERQAALAQGAAVNAATNNKQQNYVSTGSYYLDKIIRRRTEGDGTVTNSTAQSTEPAEENRGGVLGGISYLGQSLFNGAVRGIEGIVDYTVGGIASIFGAKSFAEKLMTEDWYNYDAAAEKYNPSGIMKFAGDVTSGVGQGAFAIGVGALTALATGGASIPATVAGLGATFLSSAGTAVSDAAKNPDADRQGLDYTDWLGGSLLGGVEAGIEAVTGGVGDDILRGAGRGVKKALGKTAGEMGSEIAEAITKKAVKNTVTSSVGRDLLKEMAGEGLEEAISTFVQPYIERATYDKDAKNATAGDLAYSALVGALAGGATMGGVELTKTAINTTDSIANIKRGSDIAKDSKKTADLLKNAETISSYEREKDTGSEIFEAVSSQYEKIKISLESTGGVARTTEQKKMLGELDRYVASAAMQPALVNAAKGVALNAESFAENLNAFYRKTNANKTITAADLTAGLKMDGSSKEFVRSVNQAMRTNSTLREVVVNNTLGRMEMDARADADYIYEDTKISAIATQENINRFVETADADTLASVNAALGVDMRTATPEAVASAVKQFRDSGAAQQYESGVRDVREAKAVEEFIEDLPTEADAAAPEFPQTAVAPVAAEAPQIETGNVPQAETSETSRVEAADVPPTLPEAETSETSRVEAADVPPTLPEAETENVEGEATDGLPLPENEVPTENEGKSTVEAAVKTEDVGDAQNVTLAAKRPTETKALGSAGDVLNVGGGSAGAATSPRIPVAPMIPTNTAAKTAESGAAAVRTDRTEQSYVANLIAPETPNLDLLPSGGAKGTDFKSESLREGVGDVTADTRRGNADAEIIAQVMNGAVDSTRKSLPTVQSRLREGVTRFKSDATDIAIIKRGGSFRVYDYSSGRVTRTLTRSELQDFIRSMYRSKKSIAETVKRLQGGGRTDGDGKAETGGDANNQTENTRKIQKLGKAVLGGNVGATASKTSDSEYREKIKAKADEKVKKARAEAKEKVAKANEKARDAKAEAKAYAKEKIAEAKETFDDKVTSLEGRAQDAEHKAEATVKKYGYEERAALVKVLMPEAKTEEEKRSLFRYMEQLRLMADTLGERAVLVQEHEDARAKLKEAKTSAEKSKIRKAITSLEERIELIENVISRRDSELFEIGAMQPLRELVQRAYKLGKSDGANSRVTTGVIKKRLAELFHSKSFSHSEAKATIKQIANRFNIEDFSVKSQWASRLWEQLNDTDNRTSQKKAINALADEITRYLYRKETKGMSAQAALVRRVQKYKHRLVFSEYERQNLKKYYTSEYDNIMSIWEYDGDKNVVPKHVSDILWDAGQVREYSEFSEFENASPSFKIDKFYDLLSEFETHEERVTEISDSAKSAKQEILDILWEGFENGGRETYKAKYDYEVKNRKLYRTLERRVAAFADLEKGRFKNATEGGGLLFVNTLDQIPKMLYKGSFYPQRAKKVLVDLNKWYTTDNNMLGYVSEENPGLFNKDIKNMLEFLPKGDNNVKFTYEQLEMLDQVLQYFYNFVEHYNKIYRKGKWEDALPVAEQMLSVAQKQESSNKMPLEKIYRSRYVKGFGDTESVMKICDSYEDGIFTDTFYELREGYIDAQVLEMDLKSEFDAFIANKKNKKFFDSLYEKTAEVNGVKIPRYALIGYYLSLQREHSRAGLAYNGFFVPSADNKKLIQVPRFATMDYVYDEQKTQEENKLAEQSMINRFANEEMLNLKKILTSQEKEYISIIEKTFASCKVIKEEADVNMYGYSNCVDGYYYPTRRYATGIGATLDVYAEMSGVDRFTNASFNKNTVKGAKQALYIEDPAVVLSRHVKNLTLYAKVSPVVENFNRLWNLDVANNKNLPMSLKTFYDRSERAWKIDGKVVGFEYLKGIIEDITNGGKKNIGFLDGFMSKIRGSYATFALGGVFGGNPKVLATQLSSIVSSTALLSHSSIVGSVKVSGRDVDKYCPLAALRNKDDSVIRAQTVMDKISEKGKMWTANISRMDRLVIRRLFAACQIEAKRTKGLKLGTEANKIEAGKILHDVILETQQNALITERTESMRSGSEFSRSLSMFRGDSIKNFGRLIDATGEILYLKAQLSEAKGEERALYEARLKEASKKFEKSLGSTLANAALLVGIGHLFEMLLAKEDDEETPWWIEALVDMGGNLLGGLPLISQAYSRLVEGYTFEGFEYSMVNDLLDALDRIFDSGAKFIEGKLTWGDVLGDFEKNLDAIGQLLGIPTRNVRNFVVGIIKRISAEAGYRIEDIFKNKNYASDLEDAIEGGDDDLALTIIELALKERLGSGLSEEAIFELARLAKLGEGILPSAVGDTITIDGEERELSGAELKAVRAIYAAAAERINVFVGGDFYDELTDEQKASAIRKIYTLYKDLGYDSVLGTERDKKALVLSRIVSGDALVMWDVCSLLEADKDEDGKTISGSKKEKVIKAIWGLDIPDVQKLLLIGMRGYKIDDDDIPGVSGYAAQMALYEYIESLEGLSDGERLELFDGCGFEIKNGVAQEPTYSGSSSGGGSNKVTKIGRVTTAFKFVPGGSMKGSMQKNGGAQKLVKIGRVVK
jgi:hypothetical protein